MVPGHLLTAQSGHASLAVVCEPVDPRQRPDFERLASFVFQSDQNLETECCPLPENAPAPHRHAGLATRRDPSSHVSVAFSPRYRLEVTDAEAEEDV